MRDKMMAMAQKVLSFDPDDPEALLGVAQVLAERTHDTDLDKDQRPGEAKKRRTARAGDCGYRYSHAGAPPEQLNAFKGFLRSEAYAILGTLDFNAKAWADAEGNLRKSIDAFPQQVDPVAVFRLVGGAGYAEQISRGSEVCQPGGGFDQRRYGRRGCGAQGEGSADSVDGGAPAIK